MTNSPFQDGWNDFLHNEDPTAIKEHGYTSSSEVELWIYGFELCRKFYNEEIEKMTEAFK